MRCPKCGSLTNYERNRLSDKQYPPFFSCDCGCLWTEEQQTQIKDAQKVIKSLKDELGYYSFDHPAFNLLYEYISKYGQQFPHITY
jgi:hypothetical protein